MYPVAHRSQFTGLKVPWSRKKTYLSKKILQDNHEKCKSCKIPAEKANLARV